MSSWRRQQESGRPQQLRRIESLDQLKRIAADGHLTNELRLVVDAIHVTNQAPALAYWPPAICHFERMTTLNLAGNVITYVPAGVSALLQLQILDLSHNQLTNLPPEICELRNLNTFNLMKNQLTVLPASFGKLRNLKLLGLKSNELVALPDSFTQLGSLVELFITDNKLIALPEGFGALTSLVKLQAAFNAFTHLPPSLFTLPRLEMLRVAVCNIQRWPSPGTMLLNPDPQSPEGAAATSSSTQVLPRLAWCSLGGNPVAAPVPPVPSTIPTIPMHQLDLGTALGDGASGEVLMAQHNNTTVAVKLFHADVSPDGRTAEEVGISCQLDHPNLTKVHGLVPQPQETPQPEGSDPSDPTNGDSNGPLGQDNSQPAHADAGEASQRSTAEASPPTPLPAALRPRGMVLGLVPGRPLAAKPTSAHLLRCKWPEGVLFPVEGVVRACAGAAAALGSLHARGIAHGDVYAHNLLVDPGTWQATLCDFGAAFCYDPAERFWEAMEVRAYGLMMADMVDRFGASAPPHSQQQQPQQQQQQQEEEEEEAQQQRLRREQHVASLQQLVSRCLSEVVSARPSFAMVVRELEALLH